MIVVDASVVAEILLATPHGEALAEEFFSAGVPLQASHLLDIEVTSALRHCLRRGEISAARCETAVADLANLRIHRHGHQLLLARIWELRDMLTAYDAAYAVLGEMLGAKLVTRDARLGRAPGLRVEVLVR